MEPEISSTNSATINSPRDFGITSFVLLTKLRSTDNVMILTRRRLKVRILDIPCHHWKTHHCCIGKSNPNTLTTNNTSIICSSRLRRPMAIEHPACFPSEIHFAIKYDMATNFDGTWRRAL